MTRDCHVRFGERLAGRFRRPTQLDLVQLDQEPIGNIMTKLRHTLDPWLGKPKYKQGQGRVTFLYRFESETPPHNAFKVKD